MRTNADRFENKHPSEAQLVLAMDEELAPHQIADIARHVDGCPECRAQWNQLSRISERIMEYHHALQSGRLPAPKPIIARPMPFWRIARVASGIAAAAAFVCIGWLLMEADRASPPPRQAEVPRVAPRPERKSPATPVAKVHRTSPHKRTRLVASVAEMSNIIELPFSDRSLPLGDATVVRVQLPIEELRLTGLAVDGARTGTLVQADVLMGIDGLPRAIRLVQ